MKALKYFVLLAFMSSYSALADEDASLVLKGILQPNKILQRGISENGKLIEFQGDRLISIDCACFTGCEKAKRCEWVIDFYNKEIANSNRISEFSGISARHFEITDGGDYGCFTVFGVDTSKFVRIDVGLFRGKSSIKLEGYKMKNVKNTDMSSENSDATCLWVL